MPRITLTSGCSYTAPVVSPANWRTKKASTGKDWFVTYRFYDPAHKGTYPNGKQVMVKGMNATKDLCDRQAITAAVLDMIHFNLQQGGFNPITGKAIPVLRVAGQIGPESLLPDALQFAYNNYPGAKHTKEDMDSMLTRVQEAIARTGLSYLYIQDTRRKHVLALLQDCEKHNSRWSAYLYNKYRAYLMALFKILVKHEAIENNPVDENIEKAVIVKKVRSTLTPDQRKQVRERLEKEPDFFRLVQIFFHSGGRLTELCEVRTGDVDIFEGRYKAVIKKGKLYREVWRPIKNIAVPLWMELLDMAQQGDYLFGRGMKPGRIPCRPDFLSKKWNAIVKKELGIDCDVYSLKHSNLTEISETLGAKKAAQQAGHTTEGMVISVYDTRYQKRKDDELRQIANEF